MEIKGLLNGPKKGEQSYEDYFAKIAKILMNNYVIKKGENISYEIVEIEFYLFDPGHPDVITYPRNCAAGQWFFHQSGVDLTFASTTEQFGGILIRGLRKMSDNKLFLGPQKCVNELWDKFDAFKVDSNYPVLVLKGIEKGNNRTPGRYPRWIPLNHKKLKEYGGDEAKVRELKVRELILTNSNYLNEHSKLGLSSLLYKDLQDDAAIKTTFEMKYRFIDESIYTDKSWTNYKAKPKSVSLPS